MKKKRIPLIISAVIFFCGSASLIYGLLKNSVSTSDLPVFDPFTVSENDINNSFYGTGEVEIIPVEKTEKGSLYIGSFSENQEENSDYAYINFYVPSSSDKLFLKSAENGEFAFIGKLKKCDDAMISKIRIGIAEHAILLYAADDTDLPEDQIEAALEKMSPYYIEVTDTQSGNFNVIFGIALLGASAFIILAALFRKKFFISLIILLIVLIIAVLIKLSGKIRTVMSVKTISDGFYSMTYYNDYKSDAYLNAGISSKDELFEWISEEQFNGISINSLPEHFCCSTFSGITSDGNSLFGRNFDFNETDTLIVRTEPDNGYASCSMVDLKLFGIDANNGIKSDSLQAKALMLAAPYICMDGINEAGVGVGILSVPKATSEEEQHQDNGNTDMIICAAVRGILDKCSTTDQATEFLASYDIYAALGGSFHLFITDKSGKSVVVEWIENEMMITESSVCTNHLLCQDKSSGDSKQRFDIIKNILDKKDGILTQEEAMSILSDVSWQDDPMGTEWSCVYNLNDFTVDVCLDRNYENVYSFSCKDGKLKQTKR